MKLEDQIINLELAKKLKELDVKQDSACYWSLSNTFKNKYHLSYVKHEGNCSDSHISAFTTSELLELLPNTLTLDEIDTMTNGCIEITKALLMTDNINIQSNYIINYRETTFEGRALGHLFRGIHDTNLANACAKLLIYLIENGLIKNDL